jgi:alkanesulfonate monooxygenase SsuD/methylene tetrahydromethanopterin reductase-like flavin-dependent oxidoreductase (luciferase family)
MSAVASLRGIPGRHAHRSLHAGAFADRDHANRGEDVGLPLVAVTTEFVATSPPMIQRGPTWFGYTWTYFLSFIRTYPTIVESGIMEFYVFVPQMRLSMPELVAKAQMAEAAGFLGFTGMDHLAPPLAIEHPMYEAMVTATWIASHTQQLRVGSLVLCDSFRHPAMLAREAVSIDHASDGRFDLGIGWGSVADEFSTFGIGPTEPSIRIARMKETLEIVTALWAGEKVDHEGEHFSLKNASQAPRPLRHIPIVIGGAGRKTMTLVSEYADWWNLHVGILDKLEMMRPLAGNARVSLQLQVAFVHSEAERANVTETAHRRFGRSGPVIGTGLELVDHFGRLAESGVERVYVWFCDFAQLQTIAAFGQEVIAPLS